PLHREGGLKCGVVSHRGACEWGYSMDRTGGADRGEGLYGLYRARLGSLAKIAGQKSQAVIAHSACTAKRGRARPAHVSSRTFRPAADPAMIRADGRWDSQGGPRSRAQRAANRTSSTRAEAC